MLKILLSLLTFISLMGCLESTTRNAGPLNDWRLSCSPDAGSVRQVSGGWDFSTGNNNRVGGIFDQRAEIVSDNFPINRAGDYLFTTTIAMTSPVNREFSIFSIHDGRRGCAPPMQLFVQPDGRMYVASAIKTGAGQSCIDQQLGGISPDRILRNGTEQDLRILVQFDGAGGFGLTVWLDGEVQITGRYRPPSDPNALVTDRFFFKHGVYSRTVFDYLLQSRGMQVVRVLNDA
ncbi:hypothetical protein [Pseudooctadecabacter jejudonensis]|uniref:Lipoprotein n=1 Tax=Pseudooctadecabacter jejudonensis TaxID=1391910 RepID=A0A1Y5RZ16_9RHOB|nr:hypothetical protein [Pseudooctadecabacter jejudonensis]SLN28919.1 hypothetical protein PSJ8397_01234 [Pseudooctadecabacter jejudonensis]